MFTREKMIADVIRSFGWPRMTASRHVCQREALLKIEEEKRQRRAQEALNRWIESKK